jgi:hypothetical protein
VDMEAFRKAMDRRRQGKPDLDGMRYLKDE